VNKAAVYGRLKQETSFVVEQYLLHEIWASVVKK